MTTLYRRFAYQLIARCGRDLAGHETLTQLNQPFMAEVARITGITQLELSRCKDLDSPAQSDSKAVDYLDELPLVPAVPEVTDSALATSIMTLGPYTPYNEAEHPTATGHFDTLTWQALGSEDLPRPTAACSDEKVLQQLQHRIKDHILTVSDRKKQKHQLQLGNGSSYMTYAYAYGKQWGRKLQENTWGTSWVNYLDKLNNLLPRLDKLYDLFSKHEVSLVELPLTEVTPEHELRAALVFYTMNNIIREIESNASLSGQLKEWSRHESLTQQKCPIMADVFFHINCLKQMSTVGRAYVKQRRAILTQQQIEPLDILAASEEHSNALYHLGLCLAGAELYQERQALLSQDNWSSRLHSLVGYVPVKIETILTQKKVQGIGAPGLSGQEEFSLMMERLHSVAKKRLTAYRQASSFLPEEALQAIYLLEQAVVEATLKQSNCDDTTCGHTLAACLSEFSEKATKQRWSINPAFVETLQQELAAYQSEYAAANLLAQPFAQSKRGSRQTLYAAIIDFRLQTKFNGRYDNNLIRRLTQQLGLTQVAISPPKHQVGESLMTQLQLVNELLEPDTSEGRVLHIMHQCYLSIAQSACHRNAIVAETYNFAGEGRLGVALQGCIQRLKSREIPGQGNSRSATPPTPVMGRHHAAL